MQGQEPALTRGHAMSANHHQKLMQLKLRHVLPEVRVSGLTPVPQGASA